MEQLQTFFTNNQTKLTNILVTEKAKQGYGALFVELKKNKDDTPERINCYYLKMIAIPQKIREDIKISTVETVDEVLKIALKNELKPVEWTEVENISKSGKEEKSQASIQ